MEFMLGATAAVGAIIFTNPFGVVKTRIQLQGELQKKGQYTVIYKNFFHALYVIGKTEGILALQKGLVSVSLHQFILNGFKLGGYQVAEDKKLNKKKTGETSILKTAFISGFTGGLGALVASPFNLAKTRLQSHASKSIAVGYQHKATNMSSLLKEAYLESGIRGMWRGTGGSVARLTVSSSSQLTGFYIFKDFLNNNTYYQIPPGFLNTFLASMVGGLFIAVTVLPLDVISTRLYNQGIDKHGKGLLYSGVFDCMKKMWRTEGLPGFYKGFVPCYMFVGPHTVLCFIFWEQLKKLHSISTK